MSIPSSDSAAIRQIIRGIRKHGWKLHYVHNGEEKISVKNENEAIDAITAVEEAWLFVTRPDTEKSNYVFFVLGNDPDEVANDYTMPLADAISSVTDGWE